MTYVRRFRERAACALLPIVLVSANAYAEPVLPADATPVQKKEAMDHFTLGKRALESRDWDTAVAELKASLEIVDSPNARLEMARGLRESGKLDEAWEQYRLVVDGASALAAREERYARTAAAAVNERDELATRVAIVTLEVANAPAGAQVTIGTRVLGRDRWADPIAALPGTLEAVLIDPDGKPLARGKLEVAAGQKSSLSLDAQAAIPAREDPTSADDEPPMDRPPSADRAHRAAAPPTLRPFAYAAGGIGVAGVATFAVLGLMSNSAYNDLRDACHPGCPPDKRDEIDQGRTEQTLANVGLAVGVAGLAGAVTLWVLGAPKDSPAPSAALVVGPAFVGMRGSL